MKSHICDICNKPVGKKGISHTRCWRILRHCYWEKGEMKLTARGIEKFGQEGLKESKIT